MAITYVGLSPISVQTTGSAVASTVPITPTMPSSVVSGNRIFVLQCHTGVAGTTPTNWTDICKDVVIGSGAVGAGTGQRYVSFYYRDYDGVWTMPSFSLASATNLSHAIGAVALATTAGSTFDTPTVSSVGSYYGTPGTAFSATTGSSFTTHAGGFLFGLVACNDNVTMSSPAMSQSGATFGSVTERGDSGTATGNDVAWKMDTCTVTTGATAACTLTGTLSAASEGGVVFVEQTESVAGGNKGAFFAMF